MAPESNMTQYATNAKLRFHMALVVSPQLAKMLILATAKSAWPVSRDTSFTYAPSRNNSMLRETDVHAVVKAI